MGRLLVVILLLLSAGCARAPLDRPEDALRLSRSEPDSLMEVTPLSDFSSNLMRTVEHIRQTKRVSQFRFGERVISRDDYLLALERLTEFTQKAADANALLAVVKEKFDFYEVYGRENWGDVFITSYFEPVLEARKRPEGHFRQPIYQLPDDLVEVRLGQFGEDFRGLPTQIRGRITEAASDGVMEVVPYYSRAEIDQAEIFRGRGLEIAWIDPVDAFFLQIQGSGVLHFPDGEEMRVGYAGQNGHAYEAVGKFMKNVLFKEDLTGPGIEAYLRRISPQVMQDYLNKNPSYVFFKPMRENAITFLGTPAIGLRTIATDAKFFPKGAVVILEFTRPVFQSTTGAQVSSWEKTSQFMIDQDVGGAIKGPDRVDLFWGRGDEAKRSAGVIRQTGRLLYLAPKTDFLRELKERRE
jgi:membrane-bound lytic murein transglycosylase A